MLLRILLVALVVPPLLYVAAAFGALLLRPAATEAETGVEIYACDNGVHADLVVPVLAAGVDWRGAFWPESFTGPVDSYDYIGLGWGSRDFYINTPTWSDFDIATAVEAVLWDETVIHVAFRPRPTAAEDCRRWRVRQPEYQRITSFVRNSLRLSQGIPVRTGSGYGERDAFFVANGEYTIIDTCNQWTGQALRAGGAPVAPWTPFSFLVLWNLPMISK
ncbi:MAG TPA: TIGR02117 family protein [Xanthobacteraceae bacterium]|jgi:uncharacterized protein (TIGR02117 family)